MCNKAIVENGGTWKSVCDCYKNHEMCNKAVDNYPHTLAFVPECFMTQKMCDKAVNTYPIKDLFLNATTFNKCVINQLIRYLFVFDSVPDWYKTQETCDRVDSEDPFLLVYCPDKYISQNMCDKVVEIL